MINRKLLFFLLIVLSFISCNQGNHYHHAVRIPSDGWEIGNVLHFEDSLFNNTPEVLQIELNLRHNSLYAYSNIWLYVRTSTSDGHTRIDTVNWELAKPSGRWLGKGWGSLYSIDYRLPEIKLKKTDTKRWFKIYIQHGLSDKVLTGVEDISVRIFSEK